MSGHWMETAIGSGPTEDNLLAEDENGDLFVPSLSREMWWDRRFNPRNPLHWSYWLRSRIRRNVVMIETAPSTPNKEQQ